MYDHISQTRSQAKPQTQVHVVGGGLAGSESAYFLASQGIEVILHEMRGTKTTPAHHTEQFAELVCSNSFKSKVPTSAPGILKNEMNQLNSLILRCADQTLVPGGEALTVDRERFSLAVTHALRSHPNISILREEVIAPIPQAISLFATGPLTSLGLSQWIANATSNHDLYFYDAIAPIIDASTLDQEHLFPANRYDKGEEVAYLNCPLNQEEYSKFIDALLAAEKVPPHAFEKEIFFQGCQPIEAIAAGGRDSLRFGPMKPVGLVDPKTNQRPYAVLQLRPENPSKTAYNLVGFQTKLTYKEQKNVFRHIPALKNIEFIRLGSVHRNTYICSPRLLRADLSLKKYPSVYFAGQMIGVEGYLESAASGLLAAIFILQRLRNQSHSPPPANTAMGALLKHVIASDPEHYSPANIHFGLLDPIFFENLDGLKKDALRQSLAVQAAQNFTLWKNSLEL